MIMEVIILSTPGERIKKLRKTLHLNQTTMGAAIGLTVSAISNIEKGQRLLNKRHIKMLHTAYNVSEKWLEFGIGEMFDSLSPDEEFLQIITEIQLSDDPFIRRALKIYWNLSDEGKAAVQRVVDQLAGKDES